MSEYEPGDQVLIKGEVVRHEPGVGVLVEVFSKTDQYNAWIREDLVTSGVVLDLYGAAPKGWKGADLPNWLRTSAARDAAAGGQLNLRPEFLRNLADQIEAQAKPPRIPEPGQFGVVEAASAKSPGRHKWVRQGDLWWNGAAWTEWIDLNDPVLIREGVEE